jgi:hypothetical protein
MNRPSLLDALYLHQGLPSAPAISVLALPAIRSLAHVIQRTVAYRLLAKRRPRPAGLLVCAEKTALRIMSCWLTGAPRRRLALLPGGCWSCEREFELHLL